MNAAPPDPAPIAAAPPAPGPPARRPAWLASAALLVLTLGLALCASRHALTTIGAPFLGLLVDPYGRLSAVSLPSWSPEARLDPGNRLATIDKQVLRPTLRYGDFAFAGIVRHLRARPAQATSEVSFDTHHGPLDLTRPIRLLGPVEVTFFFGLYGLMGLFVQWSGVMVLLVAGRRRGSWAYALWATGTAGFLLTFYDYHTTARLVPGFILSSAGVELGLLWLAYAFPDPPRVHRSLFRIALLCSVLLIAGAAALLLWAPLRGADLLALRGLVFHAAPLSIATLVIAILLRLRRATGRHRRELLSASLGLAVAPTLLAVGFALAPLAGSGVVHLALPFAAPILPLSIGYALIRHNILATTAVLTRRLMLFPCATAALGGALLSWLGWRDLLARGDWRWLSALLPGAAVFAVLLLALYRLSLRKFFPALAEFRPTIEELGDQLVTLRGTTEVQETVERVVRRWLPARKVKLMPRAQLAGLPHLSPEAPARLGAGERVYTQEGPWDRSLLVPMRSLGEVRGVLLVGPEEHAALFTSEDLALLDTIANLGAVALHNAEVLEQLDALRRLEVGATRDEKRQALDLLAAEISHEVALPLSFFRYLIQRGGKGQPQDDKMLKLGQDEVARLERMLATLRKLKLPATRHEAVPLLPLLHRARELVRETIEDKQLTVMVDVASDLCVLAEPDPLLQVCANLLRNATQAAPAGGQVGVRTLMQGEDRVLEIWDNGPGIPAGLEDTIFNAWVTTKEGGSGLGLAITQRIVRSFRWSIATCRQDDRTCFRITIPKEPASATPPTREAP